MIDCRAEVALNAVAPPGLVLSKVWPATPCVWSQPSKVSVAGPVWLPATNRSEALLGSNSAAADETLGSGCQVPPESMY